MSTAVLIILLTLYCVPMAVCEKKQIVFASNVEHEGTLYDINRYGKDWVAFVNPNGSPRYVLINYTDDEITDRESDTSILRGDGYAAFYLYTHKNQHAPEKLTFPYYSSEYLNPAAAYYFLVPGWLQDLKSEFPQLIKDTILVKRKSSANVIIMDWYDMQNYNYLTTAQRTYEASKELRHGIEDLIVTYKIKASAIHIIGNCLGAHVAGLAGKQMRRLNFTVARVTGLDPVRPYFDHPKLYEGISKKSAEFVDIIHTSNNVLGIANPIGTSDFYPNGGTVYQPVCCPEPTPGLPGACEHKCAYIYYANSFSFNYEAVKCDSYLRYRDRVCDMDEIQNMGEPTLNWSHGTYFVDILPDKT